MFVADQLTQANASRMEHQVLDHVKQALRVTLDWKAPSVGMPRKVSSLQFVLKSFCRHLQRVMDLEEEDGYLIVVAEQKPNLDMRIQRLECDHAAFRRSLECIEPAVQSLTEYETGERLDAICADIYALLDEVDRHDADEIALLQESLLFDEGGEG